MADHALAAASVAQDRLGPLGAGLGAGLLAAIRTAEFSFLLRSWKCVDRNWLVAGESADFFLGRFRIAVVSDDLHGGSCRSPVDWPPHCRRHGIHVRSALAARHSPSQFVSRGNAAAAFVGDPAPGL